MTVFLAPAVKTRELDFSAYVGQASTSVIGMIGGGSKGPIGVPTLLTNPNDMPNIFGEPTIADHGPMAAIQFLQRGNQLWYIREGDPDLLAKAQAKLAGVDDADASVADVLTIEFNEFGTYGHRFAATISEVNGLNFTLTIYNGTAVYKSVKASLDESAEDFIENFSDDEFNFLVELGSATKLAEVNKVQFADGHDGLPIPVAKIIGTGNAGLQAFANPNIVDINLLAVPGRYEAGIVTEMLRLCEARFDCFALIDPPQGLSPTEVVDYHNGTLTGDAMPKGGLNSSYGAIYYPWVKVSNAFTGVDEWIPPSGVVAGAFAFNDSVAEAWYAAAGLNRGRLNTALELEHDLSEGEMDLLYGNGNVVNPIINYKKNGFVVWGNRTLQRQSSATDRVNVRRLMLIVRKAVAASTAYMLFEQNDEFTWDQWKGMVEPYLEIIKNARGLYDYMVVMDRTTVTPSHIDRNEMPGQVLLKPTKTAEFILIDFVLKPTGASFGN